MQTETHRRDACATTFAFLSDWLRNQSPFAVALLLAVLLAAGCRAVKTTTELPGKVVGAVTPGRDQRPPVDPVALQQQMMRFADEYTAGIATAAEHLRRGTNALDRVELQKWKLAYASDTLAIASGQNAVANLLDMLVLATMTRTAVEVHWLPKVYGDSARPLLEAARAAETKVWRLAAPVLQPGQEEELRGAVATVFARQAQPEIISHFRALTLATEARKDAGARLAETATSVFNLLNVDPLAGVEPAMREIAQTRLFAERALYVAQRMPLLVRWQTEMLSYQLAATPEVGSALTNLDRFGRTAEQLPALVNQQREAAIRQVLDGVAAERTNLLASLAAEEVKLRGTLVEVRQALNAGTELMRASDATVRSLDTLLVRFDAGTNAPAAAAPTNARPFDILDYAATAKEVTAAIRELNQTINSLDRALPQAQKAGELIEATGNRLLGRVFLAGAGLIVLLLAGMWLVVRQRRRS